MTRTFSLLALVLMALPVPADTSPRKPSWRAFNWDEFQVGSWVRYKMDYTLDMGGAPQKHEYDIKIVLEEMTDDEVVISQEYTMKGQVIPKRSTRRKKSAAPNPLTGWNGKELEKGREMIEVAGKKFPARWTTYEAEKPNYTIKYKIWTHPEVPTGMLRAEMKMEGATNYVMTYELKEFEKKKR